jgi:hypothetical protein
MTEEFFLHCVPVEPGDGAQPAGDGGPCASGGFQVAAKAFDICATDIEQAHMVLVAPGGELA